MKGFTLSCVVVALIFVTGCDCVRSISGRPTSSDIEEMRLEMNRVIEQRTNSTIQEDSLAIKKAQMDSLEAFNTIASHSYVMSYRLYPDAQFRYYLIAGAFKQLGNAQNLSKLASDAGYQTGFLTSTNGMTCVYVACSNKIADVVNLAQTFSSESFATSGFWILVNAQKPQSN